MALKRFHHSLDPTQEDIKLFLTGKQIDSDLQNRGDRIVEQPDALFPYGQDVPLSKC